MLHGKTSFIYSFPVSSIVGGPVTWRKCAFSYLYANIQVNLLLCLPVVHSVTYTKSSSVFCGQLLLSPDSIPPFLLIFRIAGKSYSISTISAALYPLQQSLQHDSLSAPHCTVNETIKASTVVWHLVLCTTDLSELKTSSWMFPSNQLLF